MLSIGDTRSASSSRKRSRWFGVLAVLAAGAFLFAAFWISIAISTVVSGDGGSLAGSVGLAAVLAAVITALIGIVGGLTSANQWRLDRKESRRVARHPGLVPVFADTFDVVGPDGGDPRCEVGGRRFEYRTAHGKGALTGSYTVEVRSEGGPLLTATSTRKPGILEAKVLRHGLQGTVLDVPFTMRLRRRGLLRRHRRVDITVGSEALRYTWGRSRPVLIRGSNRSDLVMRATSAVTYHLHRPVSEHEEVVAVALALGGAKESIRSPIWGILETVLDGI